MIPSTTLTTSVERSQGWLAACSTLPSRPAATPSKTDLTSPSRPAATPSQTNHTPPSRPAAKTASASTPRGKPEEVDSDDASEFLEEDCERVNSGKSLSENDCQGGDGLCYYFVVFINS